MADCNPLPEPFVDISDMRLAAQKLVSIVFVACGSLACAAGAPQRSDPTPSPSAIAQPTPAPAQSPGVCGPWSASGSTLTTQIGTQYGEVGQCLLIADVWVLATGGVAHGPGAIGLYRCRQVDATCLDGRTDHAFGGWAWFPAPYAGPVKILGQSGSTLIIDDGGHQLRFDIATSSYSG